MRAIKRSKNLFITGFLIGSALLINIIIAEQYDIKVHASDIIPQTKNFIIADTHGEQVINSSKIKLHSPETEKTVSNPKIPILMYHYIGNYYDPKSTDFNNALMGNLAVPTEKFEEQMAYLNQNNFSTITLEDLDLYRQGKRKIYEKPIILTFDDGYVDFYTNAYPVLKKYKLKALIYVVSSFIGKNGYLSADMIKEMYSSGLIQIGSHGTSHTDFTTLSVQSVRDELSNSKKILEDTISAKIKDFCYPYGKLNEFVVQETRNIYTTATTTAAGRWAEDTDPLLIPRIRMIGFYSKEQFVNLI